MKKKQEKKRIYLQVIPVLLPSIAFDVIDVLSQCPTGHENNVYEDLEHHW